MRVPAAVQCRLQSKSADLTEFSEAAYPVADMQRILSQSNPSLSLLILFGICLEHSLASLLITSRTRQRRNEGSEFGGC